MAHAKLEAALGQVRVMAGVQHHGDRPDAELLQAYLAGRDEAAFAALVKRHGRLVLGTCRRVLRNLHDAEDAFQATFVFLACHASSIQKRGSLSAWLHGVAYRMAMNAKRAAARRRRHEGQASPPAQADPAQDLAWHEVQAALDAEVARLPEIYRAPFILCCLEGKPSARVAHELGIKEGTVWSRVAKARKLLGHALSRRGIALPALAAVVGVAQAAAAPVGQALITSTARAAAAYAAGNAAALIPANVASLVKGAQSVMFLSQLKTATVGVLALVLTGAGVALTAPGQGRTTARGVGPAEAPPAREAAPAPGQRRAPAAKPDGGVAARVSELVKQLGSETFEGREAASEELGRILSEALDGLEKGAKSDDPEVRRRAQSLIRKVEARFKGNAPKGPAKPKEVRVPSVPTG